MFENKIINKYDINDVLYFYNPNENKIEKIKVFAISLAEKDTEVTYNYRYLEHEVFGVYDDAFKYARQCIYAYYMQLDEELKNNSKEGEGNASS